MIDKLKKLNGGNVYSVQSDDFKSFGKVINGYNFSSLVDYMNSNTDIPNEGNIYVASVPDMEKCSVVDDVKNTVYGGMPIQVGYCNGKNSTYNGFEYHKGSEINVAVTDLCLVLGHIYDIVDNHYNTECAKIFFVKAGTAFEMYQTTLHLSPCKVNDKGFKAVVILPRGTNTPLDKKQVVSGDNESKLLLMKNKWVIAHPDRLQLIKQGAFAGVDGENKEVKYK